MTRMTPSIRFGLQRLWAAVEAPPRPPKQHHARILGRIQLCLAFEEGDTTHTVLSRYPDIAPDIKTLARRVAMLRRYLPEKSRAHLRPWEVTKAYLALHYLVSDGSAVLN